MEPPCETKPIPRFRIADSEGPRACHLGPARAGCTNKPNFPATPGGTGEFPVRCGRWRFCAKNPEYRFGSCGILVFWYSGILGWRPEKRSSGAPARCVFGTWHVAVWIFRAKTTNPIRRHPIIPVFHHPIFESCKTNSISRKSLVRSVKCWSEKMGGQPSGGSCFELQTQPKAVRAKRTQFPGVEPKRWRWNSPPYAGRSPGLPKVSLLRPARAWAIIRPREARAR